MCRWPHGSPARSLRPRGPTLGLESNAPGTRGPSIGNARGHRNDSAIVTIAENPAKSIHCVLDADIRRRKPDEIIEDVLQHARLRRWDTFLFEEAPFQGRLRQELERRAVQQHVSLWVKDERQTTDKPVRT